MKALLALGMAIGLACFAGMPSARAEVMSVSATSFVPRCPCVVSPDESEVQNGVLVPTGSNVHYFAAVTFPQNGQKVCSFSLVYQDINGANAIVAKLVRKTFAVGGNFFNAPIVMATVKSDNSLSNKVRKASTSAIVTPAISQGNSFYYVELVVATVNLNAMGVQFDVKAKC